MYVVHGAAVDRRKRLDRINQITKGEFYRQWGVPTLSGSHRQNSRSMVHELEDRANKVALAVAFDRLGTAFGIDLEAFSRRPEDFILSDDGKTLRELLRAYANVQTTAERALALMKLWFFCMGPQRMLGRTPFIDEQ